MNKIVEKTKDFIIGKQISITRDNANILALTGKICTVEQRTSEFIKELNETILSKARCSQFLHTVEVPQELSNQISEIKKDFTDRGFVIHNTDIDKIFIIDWR